MATFSKADFSLPMMSHIAQIDPQSTEELKHLIWVALFKSDLVFLSQEGVIQKDENYRWLFENPSDIANLREMCLLVHEVLRNLAEHEWVTYNQQKKLIRFDSQIRSRFNSFGLFDVEEDTAPHIKQLRLFEVDEVPEGTVHISDMLFDEYMDSGSLTVWRLFSDEFAEWIDAYNKGARLKSCPECNNLFPILSASSRRKYCSHRCATRAGERRRYKPKNGIKTITNLSSSLMKDAV